MKKVFFLVTCSFVMNISVLYGIKGALDDCLALERAEWMQAQVLKKENQKKEKALEEKRKRLERQAILKEKTEEINAKLKRQNLDRGLGNTYKRTPQSKL